MGRSLIGVIGGSGLYDLPWIEDLREVDVSTPFGEPSDVLRVGRAGAVEVAFLARHGRGHRLAPSSINYRANIDAMKRLGVSDLIAISSCGSFREELYPGLLVFPDQFIDRTWGRQTSFFGDGCVAHVSLAQPVSPDLMKRLATAAQRAGVPFHKTGTYVCMEGPQFSTYAESMNYKTSGYDIIGMTACPEAKLAREAEIPYAMIAMITDYDCWRADHDAVEVSAILKIMHENAQKAGQVLKNFLEDFPSEHPACSIGADRALDHALITAPEFRDPKLLSKLDAILKRINDPKT